MRNLKKPLNITLGLLAAVCLQAIPVQAGWLGDKWNSAKGLFMPWTKPQPVAPEKPSSATPPSATQPTSNAPTEAPASEIKTPAASEPAKASTSEETIEDAKVEDASDSTPKQPVIAKQEPTLAIDRRPFVKVFDFSKQDVLDTFYANDIPDLLGSQLQKDSVLLTAAQCKRSLDGSKKTAESTDKKEKFKGLRFFLAWERYHSDDAIKFLDARENTNYRMQILDDAPPAVFHYLLWRLSEKFQSIDQLYHWGYFIIPGVQDNYIRTELAFMHGSYVPFQYLLWYLHATNAISDKLTLEQSEELYKKRAFALRTAFDTMPLALVERLLIYDKESASVMLGSGHDECHNAWEEKNACTTPFVHPVQPEDMYNILAILYSDFRYYDIMSRFLIALHTDRPDVFRMVLGAINQASNKDDIIPALAQMMLMAREDVAKDCEDIFGEAFNDAREKAIGVCEDNPDVCETQEVKSPKTPEGLQPLSGEASKKNPYKTETINPYAPSTTSKVYPIVSENSNLVALSVEAQKQELENPPKSLDIDIFFRSLWQYHPENVQTLLHDSCEGKALNDATIAKLLRGVKPEFWAKYLTSLMQPNGVKAGVRNIADWVLWDNPNEKDPGQKERTNYVGQKYLAASGGADYWDSWDVDHNSFHNNVNDKALVPIDGLPLAFINYHLFDSGSFEKEEAINLLGNILQFMDENSAKQLIALDDKRPIFSITYGAKNKQAVAYKAWRAKQVQAHVGEDAIAGVLRYKGLGLRTVIGVLQQEFSNANKSRFDTIVKAMNLKDIVESNLMDYMTGDMRKRVLGLITQNNEANDALAKKVMAPASSVPAIGDGKGSTTTPTLPSGGTDPHHEL